jgi:hypothetical protein
MRLRWLRARPLFRVPPRFNRAMSAEPSVPLEDGVQEEQALPKLTSAQFVQYDRLASLMDRYV